MAVSCHLDDLYPSVGEEKNLVLNIDVVVPDMKQVQTRAVDPDGGGVQNIVLYCFDSYGLFITTVSLTGDEHKPDNSEPSLSGSFQATVPDHTQIVHVVGNQNLTGFLEEDYRNRSEYEVMSALEASAGRMVYWSRHTVAELKEKQESGEPVTLIRNQAKVTVEVSQNVPFVVEGFVVTNSNAFGTIAPYNREKDCFEVPLADNPFITVPEDDSRLGDFLDVRGNMEEYIFETDNSIDNPVNVIIKGKYNNGESLYYRVVMMDSDGEQMVILRNYHYKVVIGDKLSYGQTTFGEAQVSAATNNVWLTIEDDVQEIYGLDYILSVDETSVAIDSSEFLSPNLRTLYYTVKRTDGAALKASDKPTVEWLNGNNVAYNNFIHDFNLSTGRGTITITMHSLGGLSRREGTLMVKIGRLYRKIKVTTIKKQTFTPAWASTQVYGHETGEHLTLVFNVPDDCPEEFFPLEVLVTTNILDIRHESGQELPLRFESEKDTKYYGEPNDFGYKYVFTVDSPGSQRIYFENILAQTGGSSIIRIEADHFDMLEKHFTFSDEVMNKAIILHNLKSYSATLPADDPILYYMVPQKINAHIEFKTHVGVLYDTQAEGPDDVIISGGDTKYAKYLKIGDADEFLFYSKYLSHEEDPHPCDFSFYPIQKSLWGSGGRVYGFTKSDTFSEENYGASFHMVTNSSTSSEVIRIASNPNGQPSVTGKGVCNGDEYRSVIFELGNYHPFSFSAQMNYDGSGMSGTINDGTSQTTVDVVTWPYVPDKRVEIAFDVTSFSGLDDTSVDPFGTSFEIYIDAPMLELEALPSYLAGKIRKHPSIEGRFVYTVDADREKERTAGDASALLIDGTGADQAGERKIIPFKVKEIVSAGDIRISSEKEKVVYFDKTFRVQNSSISGRLRYNRHGRIEDVPYESFVVLERIKTYNRIGTVTIGMPVADNKNMDIRLRGEYTYSWYNDPVKIQYAVTESNGTYVYEKVFDSLDALYSLALTGDIVLEEKVI